IHPLVRFVSARLADRWSGQFPPLAARLKPSHRPPSVEPDTYVFLMQRWAVSGVQEKELLFSTATTLVVPSRRLPDSASERLLLAAAQHGLDWPEARGEVPLDLA